MARTTVSQGDPGDAGESLRRGVLFRGELTDGEFAVPLRFRMKLAPSGDLDLAVRQIAMTKERLRRTWEWGDDQAGRFRNYTLTGESPAGMTCHSDTVIVTGSSTKFGPSGSFITLKLQYGEVVFHASRPDDRPSGLSLRRWLRDYGCWFRNETDTPLGVASVSGSRSINERGRVTGALVLNAPSGVADEGEWLAAGRALLDHLQNVLGFAGAQVLKAPVEEVVAAAGWTLIARNQSTPRNTNHPVFHPSALKDIFSQAASAHFAPPVAARNLPFAMEWFSMDAGYNEGRLVQVMTALENLIESNLPPERRRFLNRRAFGRVRGVLREAVATALNAEISKGGAPERADFLANLPAKLADLNRRPLLNKLLLLADQWDVPLADLPTDEIAAAISARNAIVHRGHYYDSETPPPPSERDLWNHIFMMREVVVRFVLTALGFSGKHLSFRRGEQTVDFPPKAGTRSLPT